ncbi:hypothetical protein [Streptomyces californicus]
MPTSRLLGKGAGPTIGRVSVAFTGAGLDRDARTGSLLRELYVLEGAGA